MYNGVTPDINNPVIEMPWWTSIVLLVIVIPVTYVIYCLYKKYVLKE